MSTRNRIRVDVAIVGGGIAGLWLLNLLRGRGYSAVLIEREAFGDGQTIRSQGMIHGGLKYALGGALTGASEAIAAMPARWRAAWTVRAKLDLRGVRVSSDRYYLWSPDDSTLGQLTGFLASKALRGRVRRLQRDEHPTAFDRNRNSAAWYTNSTNSCSTHARCSRDLADAQRDFTLRAEVSASQFVRARATARIDAIRLAGARRCAAHYVFAAGAGNETLVASLGASSPPMQRRPLHQVIVRAPESAGAVRALRPQLLEGTEPRLTVTSHTDAHGQRIWYSAVNSRATASSAATTQQADTRAPNSPRVCRGSICRARGSNRCASIGRNRADSGGRRPDEAYVATVANVLICWPTKLALRRISVTRCSRRCGRHRALRITASVTDLPRPRVAALALGSMTCSTANSAEPEYACRCSASVP